VKDSFILEAGYILQKIILFLALLIPSACGLDFAPKAPLRLTRIMPKEYLLSEASKDLSFEFSRDILPKWASSDFIYLLAANDIDEEFLKDALRGGLAQKHKDRLLEIQITPDNPSRLHLKAMRPLLPGHAYAVVFSFMHSPSKRHEPFIYRFKIDSQHPIIVEHTVHTKNDLGMALNRRRFDFLFSQAVRIPSDAIAFIHTESDKHLDISVEQSQQGKKVSLLLPDCIAKYENECLFLQANSNYEIQFKSTIKNSKNQAFIQENFSFHTKTHIAQKEIEPIYNEDLIGAKKAKFHIQTPAVSTAWLWFGEKDQRLDCLQKKPCPQLLTQGLAQTRLSIDLNDLNANTQYEYQVLLQNAYNQHWHAKGSFQTPMQTTIAINELMFFPKVPEQLSIAAGEFIELVNYGNEAVNLKAYTLQVALHILDRSHECLLSKEDLWIKPGEYLLLVGKSFASWLYPNLREEQIFRLNTQRLCGFGQDSHQLSVWLKDEKGQIISSYSGHTIADTAGMSIERSTHQALDEQQNFCYCQDENGSTPGRINWAQTQKGCAW